MINKTNTPQLKQSCHPECNEGSHPSFRFKEFTDEWQEKKLGDIVEFRNGKAHEQDISENGKYIVINSKFISSNAKVKKYSDKQICPVHKNDIVMVMSDVPSGKAIAKCFFMKHDDQYTLNQRICALTAKKNISNPQYLITVVNRNKFYLKFDDRVSQTNLKRNDVLDLLVILPEIPKQQNIHENHEKAETLQEVTNESIDAIIAGLQPNNKDNILSICGTGDVPLALLSYGCKVDAVDIDD